MNRLTTIVVFFVFSLNCFSQYPVVIDSILVNLIGNDESLVIDNGIGERHEFYFNDDGKIIAENYFGIFDDNDSILLFIDSTKIVNGDFITTSYTCDIPSMQIIEKATLPPQCLIANTDELILTDTTKWTVGCNKVLTDHIIVHHDNKIVSYKSILTLTSGRQYVTSWKVQYSDGKIYVLNERFLTPFVIFLKNEIPYKIEKYDDLSLNRNDPDAEQAFIKNSKKYRAIEIYEIYHGNVKNMPINKITSKKTISRFKKSVGIE